PTKDELKKIADEKLKEEKKHAFIKEYLETHSKVVFPSPGGLIDGAKLTRLSGLACHFTVAEDPRSFDRIFAPSLKMKLDAAEKVIADFKKKLDEGSGVISLIEEGSCSLKKTGKIDIEKLADEIQAAKKKEDVSKIVSRVDGDIAKLDPAAQDELSF